MKYLFILFYTVLTLPAISMVDNVSDSTLIKTTYMASINNSKLLWDRAIEKQSLNYTHSQSNEDLLELIYSYYGLAGYCISEGEKNLGKKTIKAGIEFCKKLQKNPSFESDAKALLAGFYGLSIAFNPMKGMSLGPKIDRLIKQALKLNPLHAFAWYQKGSSLYNTPRMFGGSVTESIDAFRKSLEIYDLECSEYNWQKLQVMIWLGQAYHKTEQYQKAIDIYQIILEEAPNHGWVKQSLLPKSLKES